MKRAVFIKELPAQRKDRRGTKAVNDGKQHKISDFTYSQYGVKPRS